VCGGGGGRAGGALAAGGMSRGDGGHGRGGAAHSPRVTPLTRPGEGGGTAQTAALMSLCRYRRADRTFLTWLLCRATVGRAALTRREGRTRGRVVQGDHGQGQARTQGHPPTRSVSHRFTPMERATARAECRLRGDLGPEPVRSMGGGESVGGSGERMDRARWGGRARVWERPPPRVGDGRPTGRS